MILTAHLFLHLHCSSQSFMTVRCDLIRPNETDCPWTSVTMGQIGPRSFWADVFFFSNFDFFSPSYKFCVKKEKKKQGSIVHWPLSTSIVSDVKTLWSDGGCTYTSCSLCCVFKLQWSYSFSLCCFSVFFLSCWIFLICVWLFLFSLSFSLFSSLLSFVFLLAGFFLSL